MYMVHWRRKWQPAPVFLPGESHGRRSPPVHGVAQSRTRLKWLSSSSIWYIYDIIYKYQEVRSWGVSASFTSLCTSISVHTHSLHIAISPNGSLCPAVPGADTTSVCSVPVVKLLEGDLHWPSLGHMTTLNLIRFTQKVWATLWLRW